MRVKTPHQTRIHVCPSLNTIESLFDLAKYRFWSGEAIPGVRRPVFIRGHVIKRALFWSNNCRNSSNTAKFMCYSNKLQEALQSS